MSIGMKLLHWLITHAHELDRGEYALELEADCPQGTGYATALVSVASRTRPSEPWDPRVDVISCSHADAERWLREHEHERVIADACVMHARKGAA